MASFPRTVRKPRAATVSSLPPMQDLPDIAEAEAVLLDLARVFADSALNPVLDQFRTFRWKWARTGRGCARAEP